MRSGWTPLHQAACNGASVEVVEKLLSLGAWREFFRCRNH